MTVLPDVALLAGRLAPGVWRTATEPSGFVDLAVGLGWSVCRFPVSADKTSLIGGIKDALELPAHVRSNWDSLADGLTDLRPPSGGKLLIVADAPDECPHESVLTSILSDTVDYWNRGGVTVQVVWIGPGAAPLLSQIDPIRVSRLDRRARTGRTPDQ